MLNISPMYIGPMYTTPMLLETRVDNIISEGNM